MFIIFYSEKYLKDSRPRFLKKDVLDSYTNKIINIGTSQFCVNIITKKIVQIVSFVLIINGFFDARLSVFAIVLT